MRRYFLLSAVLCVLALVGCGEDGPDGVLAVNGAMVTSSGVTWLNLCKKVRLVFTDDTGASTRYGRNESFAITVDGAYAYPDNTCTGSPITSVTPAPDSTEGIFYVKAVALGTVTISVSGAFSLSGTLTAQVATADLVLGQSTFTTGDVNGPLNTASSSTFNGPFSVERCDGYLLVTDAGNNRVLGWSATPSTNGQAADIVIGQPDFATTSNAVTANKLSSPQGVACANGTLYVADYGNARLVGYTPYPTGSNPAAAFAWGVPNLTTAGSSASAATRDIDVGASLSAYGSKLVMANPNWHRILIWDYSPSSLSTQPDYVYGQTSFTVKGANQGGGSPVASSLNEPSMPRIYGDYLVVADQKNHRVLIYNAASFSSGADAVRVLGHTSYTTAALSVPPSATSLNEPTSALWDGDHLIVSDTGNKRILIWNGFPEYDGKAADTVIGSDSFTTVFGAASSITGFYRRITLDGSYMWVTDAQHNRVLRFGAP